MSAARANGLSGWIGYAFVGAVRGRAPASRFRPMPSSGTRCNVYAHYRLTSRTSVSARFRAATNTPLVGYYRQVGAVSVLGDERNRTRLPFYSRLDLRGNRTFDVAGGRLTLFVEIINAYNRRNLRGREQPFFDRFGIVPESTEETPADHSVGRP